MSQNKGFRHFRNPVKNPDITGHSISNKGGVTMAFDSPKHISDLLASDNVTIAFSFCSSDDNFERNQGRIVAEKRLAEATVTIPGDQFQRLLHTPTVKGLLNNSILPGLDQEQTVAFQSKVKRSIAR